MNIITSFKRITSASWKQIKRSGWLAWASIMVMALAFFIACIFIILAYVSNLFLQSIENEPHIYAFFEVGTDEEAISEIQHRLESEQAIDFIDYTSEKQAMEEFQTAQERVNPQIANSIRTNVLPASLGIRLYRIQDADKIIDLVLEEQENNEELTKVVYNKSTIDTIKSLFYWLRLGGGIIMGLLLVVIFTFTLLTVEFRTFNRAEEIGVMQLVGGSLWFIRSPFIIEGAFYGLIGSLISSATLFGLGYIIFFINREAGAVKFLINFFGDLRWPTLDPLHFIFIFFGLLAIGALMGTFNSYIAIKRYIN